MRRTYTYAELAVEVNRCAAMLRAQGVGKGDRVLLYMPMIPEAVFAMLATVRIGAIHSVVFGGFAAASLATRIDDAKPQGHGHRRRRHARRQGHSVQASGRRGAPARKASTGEGHHRRSPARHRHDPHGRPRSRLRHARRRARRRPRTLRVAGVVRGVLHSLHVGNDRQSEGRSARHRWLRRRAGRVDARHLLCRTRRDDLHHQRHRLGRRTLVHHLRAADQRVDHDHVRGPADPPGSGHLVADRRRATRCAPCSARRPRSACSRSRIRRS